MAFFYFYTIPSLSQEGDVWIDRPTYAGIILYSVITPLFCIIGICGNTLSLMVLIRKELKGSVYVYLSVLSAMDLCSSIILLLSGLSRGILWKNGWENYDALIGLPLSGVVNNLNVLATVFVTVDRIIFLRNQSFSQPKICNSIIARRIMIVSSLVAILINLPYWFIFELAPDERLRATHFFKSEFYNIYNWIIFILFGIISSLLIMIGNSYIIISLYKFSKSNSIIKNKRRQKHMNIIITLVSIILIFLITEIPLLLVSRTTAITYLFDGDCHDEGKSKTLETFRQICAVLNAIVLALNFILYYIFCPEFCKVLSKMLNKPKKIKRAVHFNVFFLNGENMLKNQKNFNGKEIDQKLYEKITSVNDNVYCDKNNLKTVMRLYEILDKKYEKILENVGERRAKLKT